MLVDPFMDVFGDGYRQEGFHSHLAIRVGAIRPLGTPMVPGHPDGRIKQLNYSKWRLMTPIIRRTAENLVCSTPEMYFLGGKQVIPTEAITIPDSELTLRLIPLRAVCWQRKVADTLLLIGVII